MERTAVSKKPGGGPERPPIPDVLVEATVKAIKAGMIPDEFARIISDQEQQRGEEPDGQETKKLQPSDRRTRRKPSQRGPWFNTDDEEKEEERMWMNLDERRMGFLVVGDQHRLIAGSYGTDSYLFPSEAPLDYSFSMINQISEIVSEAEQPQTKRNARTPTKTPDDRFRTSSLRLSYNVIESMDGLVNVLYKLLDGGPLGLCWLDLSFNTITKLDEDTFSQLPNLKILYLHGNNIVDMTEIPKMQALISLISLTLHGNPVEEEHGYRMAVIYYLPRLLHLDFVGVTRSDRESAQEFGPSLGKRWKKRHQDLEEQYRARKKQEEISYTAKVMEAAEDSDDDING